MDVLKIAHVHTGEPFVNGFHELHSGPHRCKLYVAAVTCLIPEESHVLVHGSIRRTKGRPGEPSRASLPSARGTTRPARSHNRTVSWATGPLQDPSMQPPPSPQIQERQEQQEPRARQQEPLPGHQGPLEQEASQQPAPASANPQSPGGRRPLPLQRQGRTPLRGRIRSHVRVQADELQDPGHYVSPGTDRDACDVDATPTENKGHGARSAGP
ncbi:hypothetical protein MTO96_043163 [Rhipicephalus appendiculatus]